MRENSEQGHGNGIHGVLRDGDFSNIKVCQSAILPSNHRFVIGRRRCFYTSFRQFNRTGGSKMDTKLGEATAAAMSERDQPLDCDAPSSSAWCITQFKDLQLLN